MSRHWTVFVKMPPHIRWLVLPRYLVARRDFVYEAETVSICPAWPAEEMQAMAPGRAAPCCAALCWPAPLRGLVGLCAGTLLFTFTYTFVALQCETSCQQSSSLTNHPGYPFSSLVPCPATVKGKGFCSARTRLFLSQLTGDGLTSQLHSLIIPSYCLKVHPFTDS